MNIFFAVQNPLGISSPDILPIGELMGFNPCIVNVCITWRRAAVFPFFLPLHLFPRFFNVRELVNGRDVP